MEISTIGIDLGKRYFQLAGANAQGRIKYNKKVCRGELLDFLRNQKPCVIGMEACGGSNYLARELLKMGHEVKLMPPSYVKAYVKRNKNDACDAEAICEAVTRPTMRFVRIKSVEEQAMSHLHRMRERMVKARTALVNEVQSMFMENGILISKGVEKFISVVSDELSKSGDKFDKITLELIRDSMEEFSFINDKIKLHEKTIKSLHKNNEVSKRVESIPGVGLLTATAIVAKIGNGSQFKNGRQLSAFLGLVPRQYSTGGKSVLGRISKAGDPYIRKLMIQGAMSVLRFVISKTDKQSEWVKKLIEKKGKCLAAVALANKNGRIIWKLISSGGTYDPCYAKATAT